MNGQIEYLDAVPLGRAAGYTGPGPVRRAISRLGLNWGQSQRVQTAVGAAMGQEAADKLISAVAEATGADYVAAYQLAAATGALDELEPPEPAQIVDAVQDGVERGRRGAEDLDKAIRQRMIEKNIDYVSAYHEIASAKHPAFVSWAGQEIEGYR